jgi:hypothetical protein
MLKSEPAYMPRAKSFMAGGFALLAFVCALAIGTASAPALGGLSWVMVTAGAAGVVYVVGVGLVTAVVDLRHSPRPLPATVMTRGDRLRSSGR